MNLFDKYHDAILKLIMIGLVVWFIFFKPKEESSKQYWQNPKFKTDTINIPIDYSKIKLPEFKYAVPPKVVINYIDSTKTTQHIHITNNDSLLIVIDSLKRHITKINSDYIKLYSKSAKLIYGQFTKDSVRLDLLSIDGKIRSQIYLSDYDFFKYQYFGESNEFRADKIKSKAISRIEGFIFGGYDLAISKPSMGADYSIYKGNFRVRGLTNLYISDKPNLSLDITIGYKIK